MVPVLRDAELAIGIFQLEGGGEQFSLGAPTRIRTDRVTLAVTRAEKVADSRNPAQCKSLKLMVP